MPSLPIKVGLAVRRLDTEFEHEVDKYPRVLPVAHPAVLQGWEPCLKSSKGVLVRYLPDEFEKLGPLERQLEVNRAHAEALLASCRAGELALAENEEEWLFQRAVGIVPGNEDQRLAEIASCAELEPSFMTSNAERYRQGIALVEQTFGPAAALAYGALLMAGARTTADLVRYGTRLQQVFDRLVEHQAVYSRLEKVESGISELGHEDRVRILAALREQLVPSRSGRTGRFLTITQTIDGCLGLQNAGLGDGVSLAILDAIIIGKLSLPLRYYVRQGRIFLEIVVSDRDVEHWDPLGIESRVPTGLAMRTDLLGVLAEGYLRMARSYADAHSHAHGQRVARWVLELKPDSAEAHAVLGQCLLGLEQPRPAIEACERALELNPRLSDAHLVMGNACALMRRWPEAVDCYRRAVNSRPGFAEAFNNLGLALVRNNEPERALGAYNEAIRVRPDYAEAFHNLGNLHLERREYEPAVKAYQQAVKSKPGFASAHYNMGQAYYALGRLKQALEAYESAVQANPKHAGAWHNMGIVYRDLGEKEKAVEAIEKAVQINPTLFR